jgi:hypothetical protein
MMGNDPVALETLTQRLLDLLETGREQRGEASGVLARLDQRLCELDTHLTRIRTQMGVIESMRSVQERFNGRIEELSGKLQMRIEEVAVLLDRGRLACQNECRVAIVSLQDHAKLSEEVRLTVFGDGKNAQGLKQTVREHTTLLAGLKWALGLAVPAIVGLITALSYYFGRRP